MPKVAQIKKGCVESSNRLRILESALSGSQGSDIPCQQLLLLRSLDKPFRLSGAQFLPQ